MAERLQRGRTTAPGGDPRERGPYPGGPTRTPSSRYEPYRPQEQHQGRNDGQTRQRTRYTREEAFRYE
jgi:hypothetical protein